VQFYRRYNKLDENVVHRSWPFFNPYYLPSVKIILWDNCY